eukprot:1374435-Karenia_brevis.AAC.1
MKVPVTIWAWNESEQDVYIHTYYGPNEVSADSMRHISESATLWYNGINHYALLHPEMWKPQSQ